MKKCVFAVAVLMLTASAWAAVDVNCTCDGNEVTVRYVNTEVNNVRAFALDITLADDTNITDVNDKINTDYYIFPGSILIDTAGDVTDYGSAVGDSGYPGTLGGLDTNGMTIEMGSLYAPNDPDHNTAPADSNVLLTFKVDKVTGYTVLIAGNSIRGGPVVMEDPCESPAVNLTGCTTVAACVVPDVVDMTQADANAAIIAASFTVGNITTDCNDTIADGNVISSNPAAGAEPGCDTAVDIVVSTGPCADTTPPTPDPMTWATPPAEVNSYSITMTASVATDAESPPVAYYFTCTAGGGNNSAWQSSTTYTDTGLTRDTTYTYTVKARDSAAALNETADSTPGASATTECFPADRGQEYDNWVEVNKPDCWCYLRQCHGDSDGQPDDPGVAPAKQKWVTDPDLPIFLSGWQIMRKDMTIAQFSSAICGDFNHSPDDPGVADAKKKWVDDPDLPIFLANWQKMHKECCDPGGDGDCCPDCLD